MSQQNVELVRRVYEAYQRGDLTAALDDVAPDFVLYRAAPDGASFYGPEAVQEVLADWTANFAEFSLSTPEFIDATDSQVIVKVHQTAVGAQSGVAIEADFWFVHTVRDRAIVRLDAYPDKAEAFDAAGLPCEPQTKLS